MKITALCLAATCLLSTIANAALISQDWHAQSDGLLTMDSSSGLQWLDLTVTQNKSYAQVTQQLGAGGLYDGFRFATFSEVSTLVVDAGIKLQHYVGAYQTDNNQVNNVYYFLNLVGKTMYTSTGGLGLYMGTSGLTADVSTSTGGRSIYMVEYYDNPFICGFCSLRFSLTTDGGNSSKLDAVSSPNVGSWLVKNTNVVQTVPIPASAWLLGSGLLGLIGAARRKAA